MPYAVCGVGEMEMADFDRRHFRGAGQQVIGERTGERLARLVVGDLFVKRCAEALHAAAADLAFDEHRVDHREAILGLMGRRRY